MFQFTIAFQNSTAIAWHTNTTSKNTDAQTHDTDAKHTQQAWKEKLRYHHQFNIGDKVSIFKPKLGTTEEEIQHSHVWKASWLGPFEVIAKPFENSDIYLLKDSETGREWRMNVHKMRPFIQRQYLNANDDSIIEIDSVLNRRSDEDTPPSLPLDASGDRDAEAVIPLQSSTDIDRRLLASSSNTHTLTSNKRSRRQQRIDKSLLSSKDGEPDLNRYTVVKIKGHKSKGRQVLYLVEWEDPSFEDTWEPKEHLGYRSDKTQQMRLLLDYWQTQPAHIRRPRWYIIAMKKKNSQQPDPVA